MDKELDASIAFVSLTLFNIIKFPIVFLPTLATNLVQVIFQLVFALRIVQKIKNLKLIQVFCCPRKNSSIFIRR